MESKSNNATLEAFRTHRHDVLNHLQLIRAYVQLGRAEDALRSVDAMAGWLASIGQLQNSPVDERIVWMVAQAPNVEFRGSSALSSLSESQIHDIVTVGAWLESECKLYGMRITASFEGAAELLTIRLKRTEETETWWHTIHKDAPPVGTDSSVRLVRE